MESTNEHETATAAAMFLSHDARLQFMYVFSVHPPL